MPQEDPIVIEVADVLHQWNHHLKILYQKKDERYELLRRAVTELIMYRSELRSNTRPEDHMMALKAKVRGPTRVGRARRGPR